ncbi:MAG: ABC transporter ATP-binding protein [Calditrichia bacterium]
MFSLKHISQQYDGQVVLELADFAGEQGSHWLILGNSGSGKTTLLNIMSGILRPGSGEVRVGEQDLLALTGSALDRFRGQKIGIIFQQLHLLPALTIEENLLLAQYLAGAKQDRDEIAAELTALNILEKRNSLPHQLSYGQQQRAAIARALVNKPAIILADEPTSALDNSNANRVLNLLKTQAERHNATLVIATHDQRIKSGISNVLQLSDGKTAEEAA